MTDCCENCENLIDELWKRKGYSTCRQCSEKARRRLKYLNRSEEQKELDKVRNREYRETHEDNDKKKKVVKINLKSRAEINKRHYQKRKAMLGN